MSTWRTIRQNAGVSLHKASAQANVTTTTGRVFEVGGPSAIIDEKKRAACLAVWSAFCGDAGAESPPSAA